MSRQQCDRRSVTRRPVPDQTSDTERTQDRKCIHRHVALGVVLGWYGVGGTAGGTVVRSVARRVVQRHRVIGTETVHPHVVLAGRWENPSLKVAIGLLEPAARAWRVRDGVDGAGRVVEATHRLALVGDDQLACMVVAWCVVVGGHGARSWRSAVFPFLLLNYTSPPLSPFLAIAPAVTAVLSALVLR